MQRRPARDEQLVRQAFTPSTTMLSNQARGALENLVTDVDNVRVTTSQFKNCGENFVYMRRGRASSDPFRIQV
jgi:hypothetical protein